MDKFPSYPSLPLLNIAMSTTAKIKITFYSRTHKGCFTDIGFPTTQKKGEGSALNHFRLLSSTKNDKSKLIPQPPCGISSLMIP